MTSTTERIRALNDAFRGRNHLFSALIELGDLVITRGVASHGTDFIIGAVRAVRNFCDFTPDNDPHGEHDFGSFEIDGKKLFWKIDYYDRDLKYGSPAPEDPAQTRRVLTILLADEY